MFPLLLTVMMAAAPQTPASEAQAAPAPHQRLRVAGVGVFLGGYLESAISTIALRPDQAGLGFIPLVGPILAAWAPRPSVDCRTYGTPGSFGGGLGALAGAADCTGRAVSSGMSSGLTQGLALVGTAAQLTGVVLYVVSLFGPPPKLTVGQGASSLTIEPTSSGVRVLF